MMRNIVITPEAANAIEPDSREGKIHIHALKSAAVILSEQRGKDGLPKVIVSALQDIALALLEKADNPDSLIPISMIKPLAIATIMSNTEAVADVGGQQNVNILVDVYFHAAAEAIATDMAQGPARRRFEQLTGLDEPAQEIGRR
jgi:hypothetical protein